MSSIALLSDIKIPEDRQRKEFNSEAHQNLVDSIETHGLLHPIVVKRLSKGLELIAGERRLRAVADLLALNGALRHNGEVVPAGFIPYTLTSAVTTLDFQEIELEENIKRKDLTWQEQADAHSRLHQLRQAQAAEVGANQTVADTALELTGRRDGSYQDNLRKEIIIARHLDDRDVMRAGSVDEAWKILKRKEESKKNLELAASVGATFTSSLHKAFNLDFKLWGETAELAQFDCILTDPPYGMNAQDFGDAAGRNNVITHEYNDTVENWRALMRHFCDLSFLVAKPQAHAYVFCDIERFDELKQMMKSAGWYVFRTPITVYKTDNGRVPLPEHGPRRQTEWILYAIKGWKPVTHIFPDVIPSQGDDSLGHGAQKPVSVFQNLLQRSCRPGDKVLDCFAGTGTIFPAANVLRCVATGIEMSPEYFGLCIKRLEKLKQEEL